MYPLNVVVVGAGDALLPHLRRELANLNATVEAEFADVGAALQKLRPTRNEMRLFVAHVRTAEQLEGLRRLGGNFVGRPVLALVEPGHDVGLILTANRSGAAQVVPVPFLPTDFRAALECLGVQFGFGAGRCKVLAVSGATGGCGGTTLAINLAYEIAQQMGRPTVLVDLALRMGMVATYLDLEPRTTTHDLFRNLDRLDAYMVQQALVKFSEGLDVLAGPHAAIASPDVTGREVLAFLDHVRKLAEVVVLDVPCTYSDMHFDVLTSVDEVVLVGEQKVPSVRALKLVRETLGRRQEAGNQTVVINRYDPRVEGFTAKDLARVLEAPRFRTVANDYASVVAAVNHGRPLRLQNAQSPALENITELAGVLLQADGRAGGPARPSGVFRRVASALGIG